MLCIQGPVSALQLACHDRSKSISRTEEETVFTQKTQVKRNRRPQRALTVGLVFLLALAAGQAATFNIADGDVAGLIAAIQTANASVDPDTINLAANGTYTLTAVAQGDDSGYHGATGLPFVAFGQLTINGNGATIQRSTAAGTPSFGILTAYVANLTLDRITLLGGKSASAGYSAGGLAIDTSTVTIRNSTITQNSSNYGGGVLNFCGTLSIENSTISHNTSFSGYGGGGILNFSSFCNNAPYYSATTFITFSTIFENKNILGRGDAIADAFSAAGSIIAKNSVLASPAQGVGADCYLAPGLLVSSGHNIAGDGTCGLGGIGDVNSTDPLMGPPVNNGGPTPTDLPALNSPAVNAVPLAYCTDASGATVTTDQRGVSRPQGAACDIGAVELVQRSYNVCLLYDSNKSVMGGGAIPIKLQLCDASGNNLSSSAISLHATGLTMISTSISGPVLDAGNANPDSGFRFDSSLGSTGGYIFNLSTKGLTTGSYNLNFSVTGESSGYSAPFQVK
jgi:hypothetical protein